MKKRTKKVRAKLLLLEYYNLHLFLVEAKAIKKLLKTIDDPELEVVVKDFIKAKKSLDQCLDKVKKDVVVFLPEDSDF
jgi:hypothetical protein